MRRILGLVVLLSSSAAVAVPAMANERNSGYANQSAWMRGAYGDPYVYGYSGGYRNDNGGYQRGWENGHRNERRDRDSRWHHYEFRSRREYDRGREWR